MGRESEIRSAVLVIVSPTGRRPARGALAPVAAVTSSHQGLPVGCLWFTRRLSGPWQGRKGDHVWEKRCSGLDLLGCDPGSGTAARELRTREIELAYRSLQLRDDARAAPSRSPVVCRFVGVPPLRAPARVIPGRTLLEGEGWVGSLPPLNFNVRPCSNRGGRLECLFPYLQKPSQRNASQACPSPLPSR
jgi:hypothetical protein